MQFYSTNAIYDYITNNNYTEYKFAKEDIWLMIYGTIESIPKIILVISAIGT